MYHYDTAVPSAKIETRLDLMQGTEVVATVSKTLRFDDYYKAIPSADAGNVFLMRENYVTDTSSVGYQLPVCIYQGFNDADIDTIIVDWTDGTTTDIPVGTTTATHAYNSAGVYYQKLTVKPKVGNAITVTTDTPVNIIGDDTSIS